MRPRFSASIALGAILLAGSAWAHHNNTRFDPDKRITVTGTLTMLDWRNPHVYLYMDAKSDRGQVDTWSLECQPPNFFATRKISKADFEKAIGQTVAAQVSPARDGSPNGVLWTITLPDGRVVAAKGGA